MSDITINPPIGNIALKVDVNSMQVVSYIVTVIESDGTTVRERYTGTIGANKSSPITLQNKASYLNCYFMLKVAIIDPNGAGNAYSIDFSVQQNGVTLNPVITLTGQTTNQHVEDIAIFHVR